MEKDLKVQNAAQKRAQSHFAQSGQEEAVATESRRKERLKGEAKILRLRALRLAKEAADKAEADKLAAENPSVAPPVRRRKAPVKVLRIRC